MADPFEVRMRFTTQLQHLSAAVTSSQRAAQYALKYRDMDEDLHSCILEQLERNNMNNRANIMYFIEHFCELASKENHLNYVRMIQRDMLTIVDSVAPADGSGAANVKHVRRVLQGLQDKNFLSSETVAEIDSALKERETNPSNVLDSEAPEASGQTPSRGSKANGTIRVDKRQIEQRIEEDRERNKRLRESMWTVSGDNKVILARTIISVRRRSSGRGGRWLLLRGWAGLEWEAGKEFWSLWALDAFTWYHLFHFLQDMLWLVNGVHPLFDNYLRGLGHELGGFDIRLNITLYTLAADYLWIFSGDSTAPLLGDAE
uniref:CTD kinase subunit gamma n=1 Tax=Talaromyces marneffei PM1 TaxID=1077442 RepID=A0A093VJT6_TALMA